MQVHEDERVCFVVLYACICVCSFVRGCVCVCYRGLNSYQYYFLGFLIISNCTIKEPPNPILIIKAPTFCVCVCSCGTEAHPHGRRYHQTWPGPIRIRAGSVHRGLGF